jgi:hypothetical protein
MTPRNDEILEGLRPRMQAARVAHVRRMMAGLFMVPLIGFGAVAVAAETTDESRLEAAGGGYNDAAAPGVDLPDIGDAGGDLAPAGVEAPPTTEASDEIEESDGSEPEPEPEAQTQVLSLGPLGQAEIAEVEGEIELLGTELEAGWEVIRIEITDDGVVVAVKKGDSIKLITITRGEDDEIDVRITDFVFPTTTTTTTTSPPPPPTTEKPAEEPAPIVDRFVVEVPGKGSFVVEREGETLWVGNVEVVDGYESEIQKGEGWKVWVKFTDGSWNWYGKALINDFGDVEQYFWDEEAPPAPVYQWVEVPGVGAVQFKLWSDGLIYVKSWEPAEGFGFYDYNEGSPGESAKVDFEGEGSLWIVEAWKNADGGLSWSITDATAPPAA